MPATAAAVHELAAREPDSVWFLEGYDEPLAHQLFAGSDLFAMPSRFEPCGLGQLVAKRYGTPPIAHRTGGLADTVRDLDPGDVLCLADGEGRNGVHLASLGHRVTTVDFSDAAVAKAQLPGVVFSE